MKVRRNLWNKETKQIISFANINAEDYCESELSARLCREANSELIKCIKENNDMFSYGVGMVPFNNIQESLKILEEIKSSKELIGIQVFTRHLGKSLADSLFLPILKKCEELDLLVFLHPVFDERKPDNNIVFSWEYELSQAMMQLVESNLFKECPNIKIIVHHAGAMIPFFAGRIDNILKDKKDDFKKFYVDTAILGNTKALELTINYFGIDHVLYGTDAPFGIMPNGATKEIDSDYINILMLIDLLNVDFTNAKLSGIDFRGTNIEIGGYNLKPQTVYNKDLSNCNFEGIYINPLANFTGVNIKGTRFSIDNNPMTMDMFNITFKDAIWDENTTYNGRSFSEIFEEIKKKW